MREGNTTNQKLKIEFHPTYLIMSLGFILTGHYLNLIVFTSLILIHELGHYLAAKLCHIDTHQIIIYPYGGKTILKDYLNRNIHQEFFVAAAGIIQQFLFYLVICKLHHLGWIRTYTMNLFTNYNQQIIFFNLLPIYPLDGGKLIHLLLCLYFPYYLASLLTSILSFILIIFIVILNIYQYNYSNFMILILLLNYLWKFFQKRHYYYQKFLLERYLYSITFPKIKIIKNPKWMYRNRTHIIKKAHSYQEEKEVLNNMFSSHSSFIS